MYMMNTIRIYKETRNALVSFSSRYLLSIVVQHGYIPPIVCTTKRNNLILPVPLLAEKFVDLIVEISHLIVS